MFAWLFAVGATVMTIEGVIRYLSDRALERRIAKLEWSAETLHAAILPPPKIVPVDGSEARAPFARDGLA